MADQETGLPAETDETGTPADNDNETPPAGGPEANQADNENESGPEATPAPTGDEEPATPSIDEIPLEKLLKVEGVKRALQSVSDTATSKAEARFKQLAKEQADEARAEAEVARRRKQVADEDFDAIGRDEVERDAAKERLQESLELAGGVISQVAATRYTETLGEETVDKIANEIRERGGNVIDLTTALAEEATKRAVKQATGVAIDEAEQRFDTKLEARLAEAGLEKRGKDAETTGPVAEVSGTPPDTTVSDEEETYESMSEKYGTGEVAWEELLPFKEAHDKERGK